MMFVMITLGDAENAFVCERLDDVLFAAQEHVNQQINDHWRHAGLARIISGDHATREFIDSMDLRVYELGVAGEMHLPYTNWVKEYFADAATIADEERFGRRVDATIIAALHVFRETVNEGLRAGNDPPMLSDEEILGVIERLEKKR